KHTNVEGLTYATQENSYLIGCLAAKVAARAGSKSISAVGGLKIPPVDTFLAGYKAGAQKCVAGTTVAIGYSQDFIDQAKCKSIAKAKIPKAWLTQINKMKAQIIAGKIKPPKVVG